MHPHMKSQLTSGGLIGQEGVVSMKGGMRIPMAHDSDSNKSSDRGADGGDALRHGSRLHASRFDVTNNKWSSHMGLRPCTATCVTDTVVVTLERTAFRAFLSKHPREVRTLVTHTLLRSVDFSLQSLPLFANVNATALPLLSLMLRKRPLEVNAVVYEQDAGSAGNELPRNGIVSIIENATGTSSIDNINKRAARRQSHQRSVRRKSFSQGHGSDPTTGSSLFIVYSGQVRLTRNGCVIRDVGQGGVFGDIE
jgi:CRP-like cAMP-binding protein